MTRIFLAAHRAHDLAQTERAVAWLDAFDSSRLTHEQALRAQQYRAAFAMALGHREVVREVLRLVPSPSPRGMRPTRWRA